MTPLNLKRSKTGQSVLEYSILASVLCLVFVTMSVYMKNGVRAKLFVVQKRINEGTRTAPNPGFELSVPSTLSARAYPGPWTAGGIGGGVTSPDPSNYDEPGDPHEPPVEMQE